MKKFKTLICCFLCLGLIGGITLLAKEIYADNNYSKVTIIGGSYIDFTDEELFGFADIIASGKVKSISKPFEEIRNIGGENKSLIFRDYTFEIKEFFKGAKNSSEVVIRELGGEIGKRKLISDSIVPDAEKDQILFLKKKQLAQGEVYVILGGHKGKYVIEENMAKNIIKDKDVSLLKSELKSYKEKYGDKVIIPACFVK